MIVSALAGLRTAQAVVAAHAVPVFVDVARPGFGMSVPAVAAAVTGRTRAVLACPPYGDLRALARLARRLRLDLVLDARAALPPYPAGDVTPLAAATGTVAAFATAQARRRAADFLERNGIDHTPPPAPEPVLGPDPALPALFPGPGVPLCDARRVPVALWPQFRHRTGFGGGYPFTLNPAAARDYRPEEFPVARGVLDGALPDGDPAPGKPVPDRGAAPERRYPDGLLAEERTVVLRRRTSRGPR